MLDSSSLNTDRKHVFQIFCGRLEEANVLDHTNKVLERMMELPWQLWRSDLQLSHVYLLGLWENAGPIIVNEERGMDLRNAQHRCPSPFAITDHTTINPLLGSPGDIEKLIDTLHKLELKVLVDFVPNHTGLKHTWINEHPDFYKNLGTKTFSGDVVELNYSNPMLAEAMIEVLLKIAGLGVDGVRCDMAHLIPIGFWQQAIKAVRSKYPQFEFIAEAYSDSVFDLKPQLSLMEAGFNAVYDEPLYRNLKFYADGQPVENVYGHMNFVKDQSYWVHYLSNHDDVYPLAMDTFCEWQNKLLNLPGWQLFYNGSLWGRSGRLAHHFIEILEREYYLPEFLQKQVKQMIAESAQIS